MECPNCGKEMEQLKSRYLWLCRKSKGGCGEMLLDVPFGEAVERMFRAKEAREKRRR